MGFNSDGLNESQNGEGIAPAVFRRIDPAAAKEAPRLGDGMFLTVRYWSGAAMACSGLASRLWAATRYFLPAGATSIPAKAEKS